MRTTNPGWFPGECPAHGITRCQACCHEYHMRQEKSSPRITPPKGEPMEQSIEALKEMMAIDGETMLKQDQLIAELQRQNASLQKRLMKCRRDNTAKREHILRLEEIYKND